MFLFLHGGQGGLGFGVEALSLLQVFGVLEQGGETVEVVYHLLQALPHLVFAAIDAILVSACQKIEHGVLAKL